ncbi:hypothetical protein shim_10700 [Shimia sp. SK013]|uniref:sulfotransferase domain-containing protein n=1 Tax=Shimia sp. SK013 TaxID=1389006 RepID=UPI0006B53AAD|nr:sulfotransferase domain-containing protein [Shimia sp. SK013]KPA22782.1 hypothetical protein shim_10700 [Shimia sp. SK013]
MIISHRFKFVFIRPMKVGGTSTEIKMLKMLRAVGDESEFISGPSHFNVTQVMKKYGERVVDFRFYSVCRNPWDRAVSMFYHRNRAVAEMPMADQKDRFREWVTSGAFLFDERGSIFDTTGSPYWRGMPIVDHVIRYERLDEGLRKMSRQLGLPKKINITDIRQRSGDRPNAARAFEPLFDKASWDVISIAAAQDRAAFGYSKTRPSGNGDVMIHFDSKLIRQNIVGEQLIVKAIGKG